jgi:hypothetical protein
VVLILAAAGIAALALSVFNKAKRRDPVRTDEIVSSVYQSTSVLGSIVGGFVALMDALLGLSKVTTGITAPKAQGHGPSLKQFGQPAADSVIVG